MVTLIGGLVAVITGGGREGSCHWTHRCCEGPAPRGAILQQQCKPPTAPPVSADLRPCTAVGHAPLHQDPLVLPSKAATSSAPTLPSRAPAGLMAKGSDKGGGLDMTAAYTSLSLLGGRAAQVRRAAACSLGSQFSVPVVQPRAQSHGQPHEWLSHWGLAGVAAEPGGGRVRSWAGRGGAIA